MDLFRIALKYFGQVIVTWWSYVCFLFFLFYYFNNDGLMSAFFPLLVFLCFMVEESVGSVFIWKGSFLYVSLMIILKFIYGLAGLVQTQNNSTSSNTPSNSFNLTILFHTAGSSLRYEGFLFFLIFVQFSLIKRMGLHTKIVQDEENTHKAYIRLKANRFISYLAFKEYSEEEELLPEFQESNNEQIIENDLFFEKSFNASLLQEDDKDENSIDLKERQPQLKEADIEVLRKNSAGYLKPRENSVEQDQVWSEQSNYSQDNEDSQFHIETEFTTEGFYKKLEEEIQKDHQLIYPYRSPNFIERVLKVVTKKPGIDLYPLIALVQVILLVYIFICYNVMTSTSDSSGISNSIAASQFSAGMVIMMIAQIFFMVWERYITLYSSEKVIDKDIERIKLSARMKKIGKSFSKNLKNIHEMDAELKELENQMKEEEDYQQRVNDLKEGLSQEQRIEQDEKKDRIELKEENQKKKELFQISQISLKYIQMVLQIILFTFFVYYYVPRPFFTQQTTKDIVWSHYETNGALGGFYFFSCIYFLLSAIQIRLGYNPFKLRNTILIKKVTTNKYIGDFQNLVSGVIAKIYRAVPFLQELKVVMDWTFTPTTLDLFQWFKIEDIHFFLFCAKVDSNSHHKIPVGQNQPKVMKIFMGWAFLVIILLLLFGPMILFSGLNPTSKLNQITNASFELGLQIGGPSGNFYQLFINQNIRNLQNVQDYADFESIQNIENSDEGQFQQFNLFSSSDVNWQLSYPNIQSIIAVLQQYNPKTQQVQLKMTYSIFREVSSLNSAPNTFVYPLMMYSSVNTINNETAAALLNNLKGCSSSPISLPNFYIELVRVDAIEDIYKVQPFPNLSQSQQETYMKQAYLTLICKDPNNNEGVKYWKLSTDQEGKQGLQFFVLCDMYSSVIKGLSIVTIYTSVILVIGQLIKSIFSGDIQLLNFTEQPFSEKLIQICDAIAFSRKERDLVRENLLYWELIDLLRSPEVVKMLTGSYSKTIIAKRKRELEEIDREETKKLKQD